MADTPFYPGLVPLPDGVPDAYRLHPSGLIVYRGHGDQWHNWDSRLPLVNPPSDEAIAAATPLFLTGQVTEQQAEAMARALAHRARRRGVSL